MKFRKNEYEFNYYNLFKNLSSRIENNKAETSKNDYELGVLEGRKQAFEEIKNEMSDVLANSFFFHLLGDDDERTT